MSHLRGVQNVVLFLVACILCSTSALALDNPDAPDHVAQFEQRAKPFEEKISAAAGTGQVVAAYAGYERFLDLELNRAYRALAARLDPVRRQRLQQSQKAWIVFRDSEFEFVNANWTGEQFGSSAQLSRGAYRASVVKDRIVALLNYLKNY